MILSQIDSITPKLVGFALDGLSMRHQAISSNIANTDSVDYKPISVSFENQISDLRNNFYNTSTQNTDFKFQPIISYASKSKKSNGSTGIDMNTVQLNQNVIQYHALIKGMNHYVSTLLIAIKEGRS